MLTWNVYVFHRWSVQRTAAWTVSWRWQSSSESPEVIFRSGYKQGGPGWRTNLRHPARQHDTHSGECCTTVFLMKVMFCGMYYVFGFWHVWLFILAGVKHCPLLENTFYSFPLTWRGIWKWWLNCVHSYVLIIITTSDSLYSSVWKEDSDKYYIWDSFGPEDQRTQELWVEMSDVRHGQVRVHGILSNSYKQAVVSLTQITHAMFYFLYKLFIQFWINIIVTTPWMWTVKWLSWENSSVIEHLTADQEVPS